LLNWNKGFNTGCFTKDDAGPGERSGVLSSCHEFENARCTSILAFATLESSSWSRAIWAFKIMLPLNIKFWPPKSVGKLMGRRFTLTLLCLGAVLVRM